MSSSALEAAEARLTLLEPLARTRRLPPTTPIPRLTASSQWRVVVVVAARADCSLRSEEAVVEERLGLELQAAIRPQFLEGFRLSPLATPQSAGRAAVAVTATRPLVDAPNGVEAVVARRDKRRTASTVPAVVRYTVAAVVDAVEDLARAGLPKAAAEVVRLAFTSPLRSCRAAPFQAVQRLVAMAPMLARPTPQAVAAAAAVVTTAALDMRAARADSRLAAEAVVVRLASRRAVELVALEPMVALSSSPTSKR